MRRRRWSVRISVPENRSVPRPRCGKPRGLTPHSILASASCYWAFSHQIIGIFTQEAEVLRYGTSALHIIAYGFAFYGLGMVLETAFNGAGDTWTPTYLNLLIFWIFEIPLAYALAYKFEMGPDGVFWAITLAFSLLAIASGLLFRRGKWKLKTV